MVDFWCRFFHGLVPIFFTVYADFSRFVRDINGEKKKISLLMIFFTVSFSRFAPSRFLVPRGPLGRERKISRSFSDRSFFHGRPRGLSVQHACFSRIWRVWPKCLAGCPQGYPAKNLLFGLNFRSWISQREWGSLQPPDLKPRYLKMVCALPKGPCGTKTAMGRRSLPW